MAFRTVCPGLSADLDDTNTLACLKAAGLHDGLMAAIRDRPNKDHLVLFQDAQGFHAIHHHSKPDDPGFVHYLATHPALLFPLISQFADRPTVH